MDSSAQPPLNSDPLRQPHYPITEEEMNPNPGDASSRNTLLTMASILVLLGIVGITLFLYIQNKYSNQKVTYNNVNKKVQEATISPSPTLPQNDIKEKYGGVVCRRYTSIEEALEEKEIACVLDLSGQNLSTLPSTITQLTTLTEIDLSDNNFTDFPQELYKLPFLTSIDMSNNKLTKAPNIQIFKQLQFLSLKGNSVDEKIDSGITQASPLKVTIEY